MIQTYEGALTETDSILQRMKTLADQAANGTYQDDVDRDAIQLEFNQLNDELNQIADTDFNGVVVLNGGEMADGTKAVNGKFDYSKVLDRAAKQLSSAEIKTLDAKGWTSNTGTTAVVNADTAWANWSASNPKPFSRVDADKTNDGPEETEITFKYDATNGTWKAIEATGGMNVDDINGCVQNKPKGTTGTANNGGFQVFAQSGKTDEVANVVVDTSTLKHGDTIKLTFKNPVASKTGPENIAIKDGNDGINISGMTSVGKDSAGAEKADLAKIKLETPSAVKSTNFTTGTNTLTADQQALFEQLNGATLSVTYGADGSVADDGIKLQLADDKKYAEFASDATTGTPGSVKVGDSTFYLVVKTSASTAGAAGASGTAGVATLNTKADGTGVDMFKATLVAGYNKTDATESSTEGTVKYTLSVAESLFEDGGKAVEVSEPEGSLEVSKADAFNQATAPLTYTDHIVLQSGARTKDAVDFTFKYSCGGMGDLKANMNCSARDDGLGTASLKLTDQKSANYAIDRIDNAINKVSMVRATFGAVQNRLEHKIDNMNVTKENMTSAESRIRDTNMAEEMTNFTKNQILSQASQAMLAQANQLPQGVLQLLG